MTTNYKTSFLLPHDYEIPKFNYPQYVLPPVPYNYKPYTKDIMPSDVVLPLITKITTPAQCTNTKSLIFTYNYSYVFINLFNNNYYDAYYETEIDSRQIDPTIQNISKFQDAYKTIEISNLDNLQVECGQANIESFIPNRNINLNGGVNSCDLGFYSLENITLQEDGYSQTDKINFPNTFTIKDAKEIPVNAIKTLDTFKTNGLPSKNYENSYTLVGGNLKFLLQITSLSNEVDNKIKETHLQAYYTNDMKLKIRFTKKFFLIFHFLNLKIKDFINILVIMKI